MGYSFEIETKVANTKTFCTSNEMGKTLKLKENCNPVIKTF